jgi:hypothetical protein
MTVAMGQVVLKCNVRSYTLLLIRIAKAAGSMSLVHVAMLVNQTG